MVAFFEIRIALLTAIPISKKYDIKGGWERKQ
jgi:hypothetical protein